MTQYFDTHAHYDSGKFNADREEVLRAAHESGVALIVDPGDCAATSAKRRPPVSLRVRRMSRRWA